MDELQNTQSIVDHLQAEYNITDYQALKLAIEINRNDMIRKTFIIYDGVPSVFEAIAMALGATPNPIKEK